MVPMQWIYFLFIVPEHVCYQQQIFLARTDWLLSGHLTSMGAAGTLAVFQEERYPIRARV